MMIVLHRMVPQKDYRKLNGLIKKDVHPLLRNDDILEYDTFPTLDLAAGYWKIGMVAESSANSAFVTHRGLHELHSNAIWYMQCSYNVPEANGSCPHWPDLRVVLCVSGYPGVLPHLQRPSLEHLLTSIFQIASSRVVTQL